MAKQYSVAVRNAQLDAYEATIGVSPKLRLYSGAQPATCALAASGTLLAEMTLPSDWMNAAASGSKTLLGTWQDLSADGTGVVGHYRIYDSAGTTCHDQGSVTLTAGGGDMTLDNTNVVTGQAITITSFTINAGNA